MWPDMIISSIFLDRLESRHQQTICFWVAHETKNGFYRWIFAINLKENTNFEPQSSEMLPLQKWITFFSLVDLYYKKKKDYYILNSVNKNTWKLIFLLYKYFLSFTYWPIECKILTIWLYRKHSSPVLEPSPSAAAFLFSVGIPDRGTHFFSSPLTVGHLVKDLKGLISISGTHKNRDSHLSVLGSSPIGKVIFRHLLILSAFFFLTMS